MNVIISPPPRPIKHTKAQLARIAKAERDAAKLHRTMRQINNEIRRAKCENYNRAKLKRSGLWDDEAAKKTSLVVYPTA